MGAKGQGLERKQQSHDELLSRTGFAHTNLGGEPRRSRAAHVALTEKQHRTPDHDGVRSRSRCAGRHCPMLPGRPLATGFACAYKIKELRENERLKRSAGYVPLNTSVTYDQTKDLSRALAHHLEGEHADLVTANMSKAVRKGKVFVDWSQNDEHKTTICVYSLRARQEPTVSTPVTWEEVEHCLKNKKAEALKFRSDKVIARIEKLDDSFEPVEKLKQRLPRKRKL